MVELKIVDSTPQPDHLRVVRLGEIPSLTSSYGKVATDLLRAKPSVASSLPGTRWETTDVISRRLVDDLARHQERMRNMHVFHASEEVMRQAHERGMPMGRMHAMHQLNGEDYEDKSTRELMEAMEKHHEEMMEDGHMHHHKGGPMHRNR